MTLAIPAAPIRVTKGQSKPRIAPPTPARSQLQEFRATASEMGIDLMPWQETAARYLTATGPDGLLLYREVCVVVARQNGKTTLMKPHIIRSLRAGMRIMHIAQTRELPRDMFGTIADALSNEPELFPRRRGKVIWPRHGSGQEEIRLANGGSYRIAAANRGSARGYPIDIVIIDELREMESDDVLSAAEPTLVMSANPQMVYLSNAGTERSVILNGVRDRAGMDPALAYLEWSAAPERDAADQAGWAEANPALGHYPQVLRSLEAAYRRHSLAGTLPIFETEHLCRWVSSMRSPLVTEAAWASCEDAALGALVRPSVGIALDPSGKRASAVAAWVREDKTIGLRVLFDVTGNPINTDRLGRDMLEMTRALKARAVGFDPLTDALLAKHFPRTEPMAGNKHANASATFVRAVEGGTLHWHDAVPVGNDLAWTSRKPHDESGSFAAVRANDDRPITAALAAIRAVYLASVHVQRQPGKAWAF